MHHIVRLGPVEEQSRFCDARPSEVIRAQLRDKVRVPRAPDDLHDRGPPAHDDVVVEDAQRQGDEETGEEDVEEVDEELDGEHGDGSTAGQGQLGRARARLGAGRSHGVELRCGESQPT